MNDETQIATKENNQLSINEMVAQVTSIQELMNKLLKKDEHYGVIPGTSKPTLYKAGAEKLCTMFRLAPQYIETRRQLDNGHVDYIVKCRLVHIVTNYNWGEGLGSCSTMESKYKYRTDYEDTGKSVPKDYWENRDANLIGGKEFSTKKFNGSWKIVKKSKIENPDIADQWNTVLKMAKKRALVDAILTATATSDIFYQDLEDLREMTNEPVKKNGLPEIPKDILAWFKKNNKSDKAIMQALHDHTLADGSPDWETIEKNQKKYDRKNGTGVKNETI